MKKDVGAPRRKSGVDATTSTRSAGHSKVWWLSSAALLAALGCGSKEPPPARSGATVAATPAPPSVAGSKTVVDLGSLKANPKAHPWFEFRPNLQKLILAGAPETQHIALLWYTVPDGKVGLHLHRKTESVYVIDGTQKDAKGVYPTGSVYFNPPTSGHEIKDSSGFFILAYASPPDFKHAELIQPYEPVRIDTTQADFFSHHPAKQLGPGVQSFEIPLKEDGGMSGQFLGIGAPAKRHTFTGNYLLVLNGVCEIDGQKLGRQSLIVARTIVPEPFEIAPADASPCFAMGVAFTPAPPPAGT